MNSATATAIDSKTVLTTGQVAQICHVAPRTVTKWFDSGQLRGYKIPGSRDRRIPVEQLIAFMRTHGMPLDGLEGGACRVLFIENDVEHHSFDRFGRALEATGNYKLRIAATDFEAGAMAKQFHPSVIIMFVCQGEHESSDIAHSVKNIPGLQSAKVIALCDDLTPAKSKELREMGFDGWADQNCSPADLTQAIEETIES